MAKKKPKKTPKDPALFLKRAGATGQAIKKSLPKAEAERVKRTKVMVIGIGGGGGSIVSEIASRMKKASFVAANTDRKALREARRRVLRFQFGQNLTQGLGTGMNADLGREAAQSEKERIKKLLAGQDFCILVASLGGGAGSGGAPIFAKVARNLGLITYGIFTLPFRFEGEKKTEIAKDNLQKLRPNLNAISILPNERIFQIIDKSTPLKGALSAINKNLAESLEGLIETIYQPGLINIDFADLKTILQGQGRLAFLNTVEVRGANRGTESIKKVLTSPLYPYTIRGAKGLLFNITGEKELSLNEVSQISKTISELVSKEAKIIFGISQNKKYQDKIKITLLATGCGTKIFSVKTKPKKRRGKKKPVQKLPPPETPPKRRRLLKRKPPKPRPLKKKHWKRGKPRRKTSGRQKIKIRKKIKAKPRRKQGGLGVAKKLKVKVSKEPKKSQALQPEIEAPPEPPQAESAGIASPSISPEVKVRKNALQVKKETEEAEKELLEQEKIWEPPAFLRKKENR